MWIKRVALAITISVAIYMIIALGLIPTDRPIAPEADEEAIDFETAIAADYSDMPAPVSYVARDGIRLPFRLYGDPLTAERSVVLLHGPGWHGMQFHQLARHLAGNSASLVAVPDLRGHGANPLRRGDVDHIGQLEEDVADLIDHIRKIATDTPVILGGIPPAEA